MGQGLSAAAFISAVYVARFRLYLAARLPLAGAEQDLQALLEELHRL